MTASLAHLTPQIPSKEVPQPQAVEEAVVQEAVVEAVVEGAPSVEEAQ